MHDEFERAVTGRSKPRISFLGGAAIVFGLLLVLGAVGVGFAVKKTVDRVQGLAQDLVQQLDIQPALVAAEMADRLRLHARLASADPVEGVAFLEKLDPGDPAEALLRNMAEGIFTTPGGSPDRQAASREGGESRSFVIDADGEEVRFDLERNPDGGSLVIESDQGQVRLNLSRTEDGDFLTVDSNDGQVRFDLIRTDEGGYLTIDSDEGQIRFDLVRGEGGGELRIRSDDGTLRFALGTEADEMPRWVPRPDGTPASPERVYSLASDEGFLGAVAWETDRSPEAVMDFYQNVLQDQGYDFRASHRLHGDHVSQQSLWARNEDSGRIVFVVTHQDQGDTRVLLGYGEKI
jgi:hypothetical protein